MYALVLYFLVNVTNVWSMRQSKGIFRLKFKCDWFNPIDSLKITILRSFVPKFEWFRMNFGMKLLVARIAHFPFFALHIILYDHCVT